MKAGELAFAPMPKSEKRVREWLEMRELYFVGAAKSAEANENKNVVAFGLAKECAVC